MNVRKHREYKQAKETDWLEPKGEQSGSGVFKCPRREPRTAGVEGEPKSSCGHDRTWKRCYPARDRRADLTARRVRGHSIGMAEEANASGNALDKPTSAESILVREIAEPSRMEESK